MSDNQNGWVKDGAWYYYSDGEVTTGWKQIDGDWYYFNSPGGSMGWSKVVGNYYLGSDGRMVTNEGWQQDEKGVYYYVGANERVFKGWNKVGSKFYYFNEPGGSMTWDNTIDGFYLNDDGEMTSGTGWLKNNNTGDWYYYSDGRMKTGWVQYGNSWYYMDSDGKMATGWRKVNGFWYYLNSTGEMATGWINDGNGWYYLYANGSMTWNNTVDGYHLDSTGKMVTGTGWKYVDSWWYYLNDDKVATGWLFDKGNWYYLYPKGSMAKSTTIDGWKVDSSGKWIADK
ncbi:N-acetylmuramoyl-L-alanine amidase family protein, partial [Clostridium beijerinckii]|nr:N-acetylmuramoyl-L-alanine amidase family protein [Clostridium beijerinckii]